MGVNLNSSYIQLSQILSSLEKKTNITDSELDTIINKVNKQIKELNANAQDGFSLFTEPLRDNISKTLHGLNIELEKNSKKNEKIKKLREEILQVENVVKSSPLKEISKIEKPKVGLKIGFFCDLDAKDHNGAILSNIEASIEQKLPFITTRSMIKASGFTHNNESNTAAASKLEKLLLKEADNYEIFLQNDLSGLEEFLVFIPKSLAPDLQGTDKLRALDFAADGSLKKVPLIEALQSSKGNGTIEAFCRLFTPSPKVNKLFFLNGHGGSDLVGALKSNHYDKFLDLLEQQRCLGLMISSCYSGGKSSLLRIRDQNKEGTPSFDQQANDRPFLTIVHSIGDFFTLAEQSAEEDIHSRYEAISQFIESQTPPTSRSLRKIIEKLEDGKAKSYNNYMQVYFPHAPNVPAGFHSVNENGFGYSLTLQELKKEELKSKNLHMKKEDTKSSMPLPSSASREIVIEVQQKDLLEVEPLCVNIPLRFVESNPKLLSMIPGSSHHALRSITLEQETPANFLKQTIDFHKSGKLQSTKGFFIGSLESNEQVFEEVVLLMGKSAQYVYREKDEYFFTDESGTKKISPYQHALFCLEAAANTKPSEKAIRAASGGQDSESNFQEAIHSDVLWPSGKSQKRDQAFQIQNWAKTNQIEKILDGLTQEEKASLVFYLLQQGENELALKIFNDEKLSANIKNIQGVSILSQALSRNCMPLFEHLLHNGADVNAINPLTNDSLLHQAIRAKNDKAAELLLSIPEIDITAFNSAGPPIWYAALNMNKPIFDMLLKKRADLNVSGVSGTTALTTFINHGYVDEVSFLLDAGADPNAGKPSALVEAIRTNDFTLVKQLLLAGGKPFEQDWLGNVPFEEAILRSSPEIVKLLLERDDCKLEASHGHGLSPAIAALISADRKKIQMLKDKKAPFPTTFNLAQANAVALVCERFLKLGEENLIKEILTWNAGNSENLEAHIAHSLLENRPDLLKHYIESDLINPNSTAGDMSIFSRICQRAAGNYESYKELIEICMIKNANPNFHTPGMEYLLPLKLAINLADIPLAKRLLRGGADILKADSHGGLLDQMIRLNDPELVKLAIERGPSIHPDKNLQPLLLIAAENLKPDSSGDIFKWLVDKNLNLNEAGADGRTPFCQVILSGNFPLVKYCLEHGAKLQNEQGDLKSPLEYAAQCENDPEGEIFKALVEAGADMNAPGVNDATPFASVVRTGNLSLIEWGVEKGAELNPKNPEDRLVPLQNAPNGSVFTRLVELGADLNAPGSNKENAPFVRLISKGKADLVAWCLDHKADVNLKVAQGLTPLQAAARLDDPEIFKLLVKRGADLNEAGPANESPLLAIVQKGNSDLLRFSIDNGAQLDSPELNHRLLLAAFSGGNIETIKLLLDKGCKLDTDRLAPEDLANACRSGKEPILKQLIELKVDFTILSDTDREKLWQAVIDSHDRESVKLLYAIGISPRSKSPFGRTYDYVLQEAIARENLELLRIIKELGQPIDLNSVPHSELIKLIENGNIDILKFLVDIGLDLTKNIGTLNPLEIAMSLFSNTPNKSSIRFLLEDCKIDPKQRFGWEAAPAIHRAVQTEDPEIVKMFLDAGAGAEIYMKPLLGGQNAMGLARKLNNPAIIALLKNAASSSSNRSIS